VALEDICEGNNALLCVTNHTACCKPPYTGINGSAKGNWYLPNGTRVPSNDEQSDFHRTREKMVVRLNCRQDGEDGIYRCQLPDSMDVTQNIYIGVYSACRSKWHCLYTSVLFNSTAVLTGVAEKWESHCPTLHSHKVDYSLSVLYRGSSIVCLKRCYKIKLLHMVIMKLCALKDWFDYSQCHWKGRGVG